MILKLRHEIFIAKLITLILLILTLLEIRSYAVTSHDITSLFMHYNRKLSHEQAQSFTEIVYSASAKYNVSADLIAAIIVCESSAKPRVVSKTGDYGLMQIHYNAHKQKVTNRNQLFNPEINIFLGTQIFAQCRAKTRTLSQALKRYSGGNKKYVRRVLKIFRELAK